MTLEPKTVKPNYNKTYISLHLCSFPKLPSLYRMSDSSFFMHAVLQILTGHQDNAEFALAMCPTEPLVLSGG